VAKPLQNSIVEIESSGKHLVHFAKPRRIEQNFSFTRRQMISELDPDPEIGRPGFPFGNMSLDMNRCAIESDSFVVCDRSQGQHDSASQRTGNQICRAQVPPLVRVFP